MSKDFNLNTEDNDVWLTPPSLIKALGEFDLDPCSPMNRPWDTAKKHMTMYDDGLILPWEGRVWLNPPYGRALDIWMQKMSRHMNGTALIFARTETKTFQYYIFPHADSIMFLRGRVKFHKEDGSQSNGANAPSVLIGYDQYNSDMIADSGLKGHHIYLREGIFFFGIEKDSRTWKIIVGEALVRLDKTATVSDIYDQVVKIAPKRIQKNPNYKAKIRQTLQYHYTRIEKALYQYE